MDGECTEDPADWDGAKVAQVLRDAGISPAGAAAIEVGARALCWAKSTSKP